MDRTTSDRSGDDADLATAAGTLAGIAEVMPDEANLSVKEVYEDIQQVLRVPVVNYLFRVLASEPAYLRAAWLQQAKPVAASKHFESAASELRAAARVGLLTASHDGMLGHPDLHLLRAYTETIDYVLPKLLLIATVLDPSFSRRGQVRVATELPLGIAEGTVKIPMASPGEMDKATERLLETIRERHGHPKPATFFRSIARWPEVLATLWQDVEPNLRRPEYRAAAERISADAERLAPETPVLQVPAPLAQALPYFRRRLIPHLMLDVQMARQLLSNGEAFPRNRFDVS